MQDQPTIIGTDRLVDGTGAPERPGELLVEGGRIVEMGTNLRAKDAEHVDATGLVVAPGFIDAHGHSDFTSLAFPDAAGRVHAGVSTEVIGNCGSSAFPLAGEVLRRRRDEYATYGLKVDWTDVQGYAARCRANPAAINRVPLVGHGNVRGSVVGYDDRKPTAAEMDRMIDLLRAAMQAGVAGMSTGLIYPPGFCSDTDELCRLAEVVARYGGVHTSHMRSESDAIVEAVEEHLAIARHAKLTSVISHLKLIYPRNYDKADWLVRTLVDARKEGLDLYADAYPYVASCTGLDQVLPQWALKEPDLLAALADPDKRARMKADLEAAEPDVEDYCNGVLMCALGTDEYKRYSGRRLMEVAREVGRHPFDLLFDILLAERCRPSACYFRMSPEVLRRVLALPFVMLGSDSSWRSLEHGKDVGYVHPRSFGTPAVFLGQLVRDEKLVDLPEAIRRMTGLPATVFGLHDRGVLAEGRAADVVVFDPDTLVARSTWEQPCAYSTGVRHLLVNGRFVLHGGGLTDARPGRLLLRRANDG